MLPSSFATISAIEQCLFIEGTLLARVPTVTTIRCTPEPLAGCGGMYGKKVLLPFSDSSLNPHAHK